MAENLQAYFKYKLIILVAFIFGLLMAILGPFYFTDVYFEICEFLLAYACFKYLQMLFILSYILWKFESGLKNYKARKAANYESAEQITQVFIIPNYMEDIQILKETVMGLAQHRNALKYCVMMAMEMHEKDSDKKAETLLQQFESKFRVMSYTRHQLKAGEAKSKSTNINWCARNMVPRLLQKNVNLDSLFVTIVDADSWIPEMYVDQMEKHIEENYANRNIYIYQPPQIFTRNDTKVKFFVRVIDTMMSYMHCSNLYSCFGYTMAVSNYTLSYRLLERIDFWDTCELSRGEDVRITSKAYWKTEGQIRTFPIYVPFNQYSICTQSGFVKDFQARFQQAKRHCQVQVEVSYNLVNMLNRKFSFRNFHVFFTVLEVYMMIIIIPIPFIVLSLQNVFKILPKSSLDDGTVLAYFNIINIPILFTGCIIYEILKRRATSQIYNLKNSSPLWTMTIPFLGPIFIVIFGFIPMILASFTLANNKMIYTVAPKKFTAAKDKVKKADKAEKKDIDIADENIQDNLQENIANFCARDEENKKNLDSSLIEDNIDNNAENVIEHLYSPSMQSDEKMRE